MKCQKHKEPVEMSAIRPYDWMLMLGYLCCKCGNFYPYKDGLEKFNKLKELYKLQ